jgi:HNH endonuclease
MGPKETTMRKIEPTMTKEEMIAAVKQCAEKLGYPPSAPEFHKQTNVSKNDLRKTFGSYRRLLFASGLERQGCGYLVTMESLFLDWAETARKLGKVPTITEYELHAKYSIRPLTRRYNGWKLVAAGMRDYIQERQLEGEWKDVLDIIAAEYQPKKEVGGTFTRTMECITEPQIMNDRPIYGLPMFWPFSFAPTNEQGVLFVFGAVAQDLGLCITHVQSGFPDVEAMRIVGPNKCQRVFYELEYESRTFLAHRHEVNGCDGIVCWINNWPECPVPVIELRKVVEELRARKERQDGQSRWEERQSPEASNEEGEVP